MQKYFAKFNLETKSDETDSHFSGYASIFNIADSAGDVILPGAFKDTLIAKKDVKFLWQHDSSQPIGKILEIHETIKGLFVKCEIMQNLNKGKEAHELLKSGVIDSLSIGFIVDDYFHANGLRYIKKLTLFEVSLVTFPANNAAKVITIKSMHILGCVLERAKKALVRIS
jgi:HK97 family phage prohead protease